MKINLRRFLFENDTTLGYLLVNNEFECFTLEDKVREVKIMHETAISTGVYRIVMTDKNRWNKMMPLLSDVPNFQGIYIHSGNDKDDTSGCILVAEQLIALDKNAGSKIATDKLYAKIRTAFDAKEDIFISVENYIPPML